MPSKSIADKYLDEVVKGMCDHSEQLKYVFTAVADAVQERTNETVILMPQNLPKDTPGEDKNAYVMHLNISDTKGGKQERAYIITYGVTPIKKVKSHAKSDLLARTIDVAHELGHILLERGGPGSLPLRPGITETGDLRKVREIEADWMALCLLLMYGYIFPNPD